MKIHLFLPAVVCLAWAGTAAAQSTAEKIESKTKQAVRATGNAIENAARKTGDAVENATKKVEEKLSGESQTATKDVDTEVKTVSGDVSNSEIYQKVERALGKPLSPEQRAQYAAAWQAAQDKARAVEKEFAEQLSSITTVSETKTKQIVHSTGL